MRASPSKKSGLPGRRRRAAAPPALRHGVRLVLLVAAVVLVVVAVELVRETAVPPARPELGRGLGHQPGARARGPASGRAPGTEGAGAPHGELERLDAAPDAALGAVETAPRGVSGASPLPAPPAAARPQVALVIDDLGRGVEILEHLARLDVPLTYAVLPYESQTDQVVAWLRGHGAEMLCHLPMEPANGHDPGPGALRRAMSKRELVAATARALARVPVAVGVNNHMGSSFSTERRAMRTMLGVLAKRDLYYLDSRTTAATVGYQLARKLGLRAAERQVFLDNVRDRKNIQAQFVVLLEQAIRHGGAISIAHPYPETVRALAELIPRARAAGYVFVPVSALVRRE